MCHVLHPTFEPFLKQERLQRFFPWVIGRYLTRKTSCIVRINEPRVKRFRTRYKKLPQNELRLFTWSAENKAEFPP